MQEKLRSSAELPKPTKASSELQETQLVPDWSVRRLEKPVPPPGYKPKRQRTPKTIKWDFCRNCYKDLPESKRTAGRNREFCSEKCRVAYNRAEFKASEKLSSTAFGAASQIKGYENLGFSKETLDTLRTMATHYPQSQAIGNYPYDPAQLAVNLIINETKPLTEKILELYDHLRKYSEKLEAVGKELAKSKEEISRLNGESGITGGMVE